MESVIVSDFGVTLGKTSERLVVRGPRPRLEYIEGGPQLLLPIEVPSRAPLQLVTVPSASNSWSPSVRTAAAVSTGTLVTLPV